MPRQATIYRVFIASPNDCQQERSVIPEIIAEWNRSHSIGMDLFFEPVLYETDARPEIGNSPQDSINWQLINNADILVACFWTRIGSLSPEGIPHTVEEINQFVDSGRPSLLYFSACPPPMHLLDPFQLQKLQEFKIRCQADGLYASYETIAEFKTQLMRHLSTLAFTLKGGRKKNLTAAQVNVKKKKSKYDPTGDLDRLKVQGKNVLNLDREAIDKAFQHIRCHDKNRTVRILDVGCADGMVTTTRFCDLENITVHAIDLNEQVIDRARNHFESEKIQFEVADFTDPSFSISPIDFVFAALTLHHVGRDEGALSRLWSLIKPGGAMLVRSPDDGLKLTYPSSTDFDALLWAPSNMPGSSDRVHGRKLYTQMKRLDPSPESVQILMNHHTTAGLSAEERHAFFIDHYGHRVNYAKLNAESPNATAEDKEIYDNLSRTLSQWETRFRNDDKLFSVTINIIALALKAHD